MLTRTLSCAKRLFHQRIIAFATDGSPSSRKAFDFIKNFRLCNSSDILKVITCPPLLATTTDIDALPPIDFGDREEVTNMVVALQNARIKLIKEEYTPLIAAIGCEYEFLIGDPLEGPRVEVPKLASECNAELLVVGSRGLKTVKRLMLGSVADASVHRAHCHVLVVKGFDEDEGEFSETEDILAADPYMPT